MLVISRELAEHDDVVARGRAGHHEAHEPEGVRDLVRGREGSRDVVRAGLGLGLGVGLGLGLGLGPGLGLGSEVSG